MPVRELLVFPEAEGGKEQAASQQKDADGIGHFPCDGAGAEGLSDRAADGRVKELQGIQSVASQGSGVPRHLEGIAEQIKQRKDGPEIQKYRGSSRQEKVQKPRSVLQPPDIEEREQNAEA